MNLILNKNFELPADGWFQIIPRGTFPHPSGDKQLIDAAACEAIVNRFKADAAAANFGGILVDYDHFSLDTDKPSEAAGWIMDLQNRADGVYAQIRWAGDGEAKVKSGAYRYVSPVWNRADCVTVNGALRPMRLSTVALTNDPNIKVTKPLSNRSKEPGPAETGKANIPGNTGGEESTMDYKAELLAVLGLPADATDEQIAAAKAAKACELDNACKEKDAMQNRAVTAETKLQDFERGALIIQVEKDLDDHKDVIANREEVKAQLMVNREGTLKLIKSMRKPEALPQALHNRDGKTPTAEQIADANKLNAEREAFVKEVKLKNRCSTNAQAWQLAATLKPELFKNK
jgi:phage I-like protein